MDGTNSESFLLRHEFLLRRLHSLTGLIPVGAYMVIHLVTNALVLDSAGSYQRAVYRIHSLGAVLPIVEWVFIFLPILFHGLLGLAIIRGGLPNSATYPYVSNIGYTLQRVTGMIALFFILWHVFHMHGWFHFAWWHQHVAEPFLGAQFRAYNAASTAAAAVQHSFVVLLIYAIGMLACVFHLSFGLWTMGITWGVWISPPAQQRARFVCGVFGVLLAAVGLGSLAGMQRVDIPSSQKVEQRMYDARVAAGDLEPNEEKRSVTHPPAVISDQTP